MTMTTHEKQANKFDQLTPEMQEKYRNLLAALIQNINKTVHDQLGEKISLRDTDFFINCFISVIVNVLAHTHETIHQALLENDIDIKETPFNTLQDLLAKFCGGLVTASGIYLANHQPAPADVQKH